MPLSNLMKVIVLMGMIACFTVPCMARRPNGKYVTGTIKDVNAATHEVQFLRDDTGAVMVFELNDRTRYVVNAEFASKAIVQRGSRIEIIYHAPVFGKAYATRIRLLIAGKAPPAAK